ncbi:MAG: SDR family oxidoreductase [Proteobacteria bacterium]|nr:SDR family oxidoreductase [Pseudomonadota bacterium]
MNNLHRQFALNGKIAVITGGGGLLGAQHAEAIAQAGGVPVLWDIRDKEINQISKKIKNMYKIPCSGMQIDITDPAEVETGLKHILDSFKRIDILINNASNNPKISGLNASRIENFSLDSWMDDLNVGLTGAFICSKAIGSYMARHRGGVILNISSDLGVIAPDQRIYRKEGLADDEQPVKPVTYSVVKHGIIGLTKYLATYWAEKNIRVNSISPGGVYDNQPDEFVQKLIKRIPIGRMANADEYRAAIVFLVSDASSYMTGGNLIIDGGRTCW